MMLSGFSESNLEAQRGNKSMCVCVVYINMWPLRQQWARGIGVWTAILIGLE